MAKISSGHSPLRESLERVDAAIGVPGSGAARFARLAPLSVRSALYDRSICPDLTTRVLDASRSAPK